MGSDQLADMVATPSISNGFSYKKFTGDAESGLDFFGARYYASSMGR